MGGLLFLLQKGAGPTPCRSVAGGPRGHQACRLREGARAQVRVALRLPGRETLRGIVAQQVLQKRQGVGAPVEETLVEVAPAPHPELDGPAGHVREAGHARPRALGRRAPQRKNEPNLLELLLSRHEGCAVEKFPNDAPAAA